MPTDTIRVHSAWSQGARVILMSKLLRYIVLFIGWLCFAASLLVVAAPTEPYLMAGGLILLSAGIFAPRQTPPLAPDPQELARLEYELELTPTAKMQRTDEIINDIDKKLAEAGVLEAQIACAEKKIRLAAAVPQNYVGFSGEKKYPDCGNETDNGRCTVYYRARPPRRAYIPKPDGRQGPLGIAVHDPTPAMIQPVEIIGPNHRLFREGGF